MYSEQIIPSFVLSSSWIHPKGATWQYSLISSFLVFLGATFPCGYLKGTSGGLYPLLFYLNLYWLINYLPVTQSQLRSQLFFFTVTYCCHRNTLRKPWDSFNLSALKQCIFNSFFYLEHLKGVTLATAIMYIFCWDFVSLTFYSNAVLAEHKNVGTFLYTANFQSSSKICSQRNLPVWLRSFSIIMIFFPYNFKYIVLIFSNKEIWRQEEDEMIGEI